MSKVIIWKKDRADYVINGVCKYFKVNRHTLFKKHDLKTGVNQKRIAIKILKDVADLSFIEIRDEMNYSNSKNIYDHYFNISQDISPDTYGNKELKKTYLEVLDYLKL